MRKILYLILAMVFTAMTVKAQQHITGKVTDIKSNQPLNAAVLHFKKSKIKVLTDEKGDFSIKLTMMDDTLIVSYVGYQMQRLPISHTLKTPLQVLLVTNEQLLDEVEVVSTGYQTISKERATGSFTKISNEQINRSVSPNILDRLEGIASGLNFDRRGITLERNTAPSLQVRGVSTIESNAKPLIIVDNFPYESDINTINPNDVESITVLKDAAAASIWGARAANGVIVITTKQGRYNQKPKIALNSSINMINKPNLYYDQNFLPAVDVMRIEKELFEKDNYTEMPNTPIPAYVELLIKKRDNRISAENFNQQEELLRKTDLRTEALSNLYQLGLNKQYGLNISGGSNSHLYYASINYDRNKTNVIGNRDERLSLNFQNTFKLNKNLEISGSLWYSRQKDISNGLTLSDLKTTSVGLSPYSRLKDSNGIALAILKNYRLAYTAEAQNSGLLNWDYKPLEEIKITDRQTITNETRINGGVKYSLNNGFMINATYQYIQNHGTSQNYHAPESYFVRNLVNEFTLEDGTMIIPNNGILEGQATPELISHSGRIQLNYSKDFGSDHSFTGLAGVEIRQQTLKSLPGFMLFNYNPEVLTGSNNLDYNTLYQKRPDGFGAIPSAASNLLWKTDRYLSQFVNAAYTYQGKYTISGSSRWDGSNLFGVKTNQKGVPLFSVGGSWELSKEKFYNLEALSYLRLRTTYGSSGNVNNTVSARPIVIYNIDDQSGLPTAGIISAGNPELRWEKVKLVSFGLDFTTRGNRIQGSLEYYVKNAGDLIGLDYMDPTTGIINNAVPFLQNKINYADLKTRGFDLSLTTTNFRGKFNWQSSILFSYVANRISNFNTNQAVDKNSYFSQIAPPVKGASLDAVYALPWIGLDPLSGQPLVNNNGQINKDYKTFLKGYTKENLPLSGVSTPPYFGSVINTFEWNNIKLSAVLSWKAGYVFRRTSISPGMEYMGSNFYHQDYLSRWKQPGDEKYTNVPAAGAYNSDLSQVYNYSTALITPGDHIRLQDVNLSYTLSKRQMANLPLQAVRVYLYARNLGILWRANKNGLDPEYANASYPAPKTYALGLQVEF